jgi:ADP-ribosylglycohydrolase
MDTAILIRDKLQKRFRGCLLGQAIGDAVGWQVETKPHAVCRPYAETWYDTAVMDAEPRHGLRLGQYSDDTQLARELALSLAEKRGWDPDDFAGRIALLMLQQKLVGGGKTLRSAVERMLDGLPWDQVGSRTAVSNGAASRAAPVGLAFHDDIETLVRVAREQAVITHAAPLAVAGSVMVATAVAACVEATEPVVPRDFLAGLELAVGVALHGDTNLLIERLFHTLVEVQGRPSAEALDRIAVLALNPEPERWDRISVHVLPTVGWALHCFLTFPDDFRRAVGMAISAGGDTDTVAAITGAISGAYLGEDALTEHDVAMVHDQGEWKADRLRELADRLHQWTLDRAG